VLHLRINVKTPQNVEFLFGYLKRIQKTSKLYKSKCNCYITMKLTHTQRVALRDLLTKQLATMRKVAFDLVKEDIEETLPDGKEWLIEYDDVFKSEHAGDAINQCTIDTLANIECENVPEPMAIIGVLRGLFRKKRKEMRRVFRFTKRHSNTDKLIFQAFADGYNQGMDDAMGITKPFLPKQVNDKKEIEFFIPTSTISMNLTDSGDTTNELPKYTITQTNPITGEIETIEVDPVDPNWSSAQ